MTSDVLAPAPVGMAGALAVVLIAALLCRFSVDGTTNNSIRVIQAAIFVVIAILWCIVTVVIAEPQQAAAAQARKRRLEQALKQHEKCQSVGLSQAWFDQVGRVLRRACSSVVTLAVILLGGGIAVALPHSFAEASRSYLQHKWELVLDRFAPEDVMVGGIFIPFFCVFWAVSAAYVTLDLWRPAGLLPFKTQPGFKLTAGALAKVVGVCLLNQAIVFAALFLLSRHTFPSWVPRMLERELPPLSQIVLDVACCVPMGEFLFYSAHRLLHTPFLFKHVHYLHHQWGAPIAPCAIFSHPIEFVMGNVTVILIGPLVMGSHLSAWVLWSVASITDTLRAHSGWHLPFLGSVEFHDYHHSSGHIDNLGVTGALDALFHTNSNYATAWQRQVDANYGANGEYAVDRVLAEPVPTSRMQQQQLEIEEA